MKNADDLKVTIINSESQYFKEGEQLDFKQANEVSDEKMAVFVVLTEEDKGGTLDNRVVFFEDEFGTLPQISDVEMVFSASRSRNILSLPIIQILEIKKSMEQKELKLS